jgi:hypothetical protein
MNLGEVINKLMVYFIVKLAYINAKCNWVISL